MQLREGQVFILDPKMNEDEGTEESVSLDYKNLPNDVSPGDTLLLDDGRITLKVEKISDGRIHCRVMVEGELSNNKGINRLGGGLSAGALTEKDRLDIREAARLDADYLAISFPRRGDDIKEARSLLHAAWWVMPTSLPRLERTEAITNIDEIIDVS